MEITEFLTKIDLKGATNTIFKKEEKDAKIVSETGETIKKISGINSYTYFDNGSSAVTGFLRYEKPFPEQIFSLSPSVLKGILEEADNLEVVDSFLVGKTDNGNIVKDLELTKWRTVRAKYDNPPVLIKNNIVKTIIRRSQIIDPASLTIVGDGNELVFTTYSNIGSSSSKVKIKSDLKVESMLEASTFLEILRMVGDMDIRLYIDSSNLEDRKKSPVKIEIFDSNTIISYYITETIKPELKKEVKEEENLEMN